VGTDSLLRLIRQHPQTTRADLARLTGLSRPAISQRVDTLIDAGLVLEAADLPSTGGRPPSSLVFNADYGVILVADLGATHARLAATNLTGHVLVEVALDMDITRGPEAVLEDVAERFAELLLELDPRGEVRAIGIGVPGPVEFATGRPVSPPLMPGWDGYSVPEHLQRHFDVPVLVDNDVNIMAVGEHRSNWQDQDDFLLVKIGTGIGCGVITGGTIYRGAQGAAGDIGHIRVAGYDHITCVCGNTGCLEAVASGRALAKAARDLGLDAQHGRDVVALARARQTDVVRLVRDSGRVLGGVLAGLVNIFNPSAIVIGGDLADVHEELLAGVREVVYKRATPLATRNLAIAPSALGDRDGIAGAAVLAIDHLLSPAVVNSQLLAPPPA
jgi:predicted NBD/HSP70 family sugar kinase